MRVRTATLPLALLLPLVLGGCGYRGPLYLPEKRPETGVQAAQPAAAESSKSVEPEPAPQAQKRDRPSQTTEPQSAAPAN